MRPDTRSPALQMRDVSYTHRSGGGVHGVSFDLAPGELIAVFGLPGCGQSTLLRLAEGRLTPQEGRIARGHSARSIAAQTDTSAGARRGTPHRALLSAARQSEGSSVQRLALAAELLEMFDLYPVRDARIRELSRGQFFALELARALAARPALLLLDNPCAFLPDPHVERLWSYLDDLRASHGAAILLATCRSTEAERAGRVLLLDRGKPLALASPEELLSTSGSQTISIESVDANAVNRTLRGCFDIQITPTDSGVELAAQDAPATAAHLFRHPPGGARIMFVRRPTLWDALDALRRSAPK